MATEKGHGDVGRRRPSWQPFAKTSRHLLSHGTETHENLSEMDAFRRMSGQCLVLVAVVGTISLVTAKPLIETGLAIDDDLVVGCYSRETNRTYAVGEKWATGPPFMCAVLECTGPNSFAALPCATFLAPDWCTEEPGDQTAVYPACCPFARCPEDPVKEGLAEGNTPKPTNIAWEPEASNNLP